jgi:RimJ/RimL family protein N-acetyltransferase
VTVRPARPTDARRIQEHFYALDKEDVVSRFFHEKERFEHNEMEELSQIDYIKNFTMIAVVGEPGFEKVVAVGEYLLDSSTNVAEVAFSVSRQYQKMGLGTILIKKIVEAARENGIAGIMAFTDSENKAMIKLFKSLPYHTRTSLEKETVVLRCRFDEPGI